MIPAARGLVALVLPGLEGPLKLHDAQLVIAREHGLPAAGPSWFRGSISAGPSSASIVKSGRVWLEGVPRLRWGASAEPTYVGALEAAFRRQRTPARACST